MKNILKTAIFVSLVCSAGLAESPKISRSVGTDGTTVITIKGQATRSQAKPQASVVPTKRKAFKVYDLEGERTSEQASERSAPQIVVVGYPPPIAPNPASYGYGYYNGFIGNGFNNGFIGNGFIGNGFNNGFVGNGFNNGFINNGFYSGYGVPQNTYAPRACAPRPTRCR